MMTGGSTFYWWGVVPFIHDAPYWQRGLGEGFLGCLLKYLCWAACLWLLMEAYRGVGADRRRAHLLSAGWAISTLLILVAMAFSRVPLADLVRTHSTHLTSPSTYIGHAPLAGADHDRIAYEAWKDVWDSGWYLLVDSTFFVLLALGHGRLARSEGVKRSRGWSACLAILWTVGLAWAFTLSFALIESTFDLFHHGVAVGCLALELINPIFAMRPESAIASPFAFAYSFVGVLLVNHWEQGDP